MRAHPLATRTLAAASAVALITGAARAQELPAAADLAARHRATVNADALAQRSSMHTVGRFSIPSAGVSGRFESWSARPDRSAIHISLPNVGDIRSGFSEGIAWSLNPMEGPRVLSGNELAQAADDAAFDAMLRPEGRVASMTTVELTTLGETACYKVRVEWKSGRESFDCYSPETGLRVGTVSSQESAMGRVEATTLYEDYTSFDGFMLPTTIRIQVMGMEQVVSVDEVTFDTVPDSAFHRPAEITTLIGG